MSKKKSRIASTLKRSQKRIKKSWKALCKKVSAVRLVRVRQSVFFQSYFWHFLSRILIISFFIGFNISLGKAFVAQNTLRVPVPIARFLMQYGIIPGEEIVFEQLTNPYAVEIIFEADDIITQVNLQRVEHDLPEFTSNKKLASAAAILLKDLEEHDFDLEQDFQGVSLADVVAQSGYSYAWVHHNALVGPLSPEAVVTAWLSDEEQSEAILTKEFTEIGIAAKVVETSFMGKAGVVVQLLAQPQDAETSVSASNSQVAEFKNEQPQKLFEFSDESVIKALNDYRSDHDVHRLNVNDNLCVYAEKRANDLQVHGSLDDHAGFKADFEKEDPPPGILSYGGGKIGENLASQYCLNGTTGESIFAENPTQLVEWCFDSSQKGHREAQLSKEYDDVCVRHADNMYVVIFGTK